MYRHIFQFEPACALGTTHRPDRYARVPRISFPFAGFGRGSAFSGNCRWGKTRDTTRVRAISRGSDLGSRMGEFAATLQDRLREAHAALLAARAAGDADLTDTQLDEIAHLREIAVAHGIPEPASA